jgi:mannosyl-oligosaccharide alpha-1,3-glucosidase
LAIYSDGTKEERDPDEEDNESSSSHNNNNNNNKGESFGGHHDPMMRGSRSVGIDFSFPHAQHVFGIPEHATPLGLPTTRGPGSATTSSPGTYSDPYRLYTLDVFEYELNEPMALYGTIPILWAHGFDPSSSRGSHTAGVFFFNPSETFVDISDSDSSPGSNTGHKQSHWMSESGEIEFFLLPGPDPRSVSSQIGSLVGTQGLPPLFSLGYHQCRWNYKDEKDVATVTEQFEALDYPFDVLWLDIEHTDGKRYFTWDSRFFPNPEIMQKNMSRLGRKMVTIVDPVRLYRIQCIIVYL